MLGVEKPSRMPPRTEIAPAPKTEFNLAYVAVATVVSGVYLLFTKDNQMYVTTPHGFDYFMNVILALQYASAVNVCVPGFMQILFNKACGQMFFNFFLYLFLFLFPIYSFLAAIAAGWYMGGLASSLGGALGVAAGSMEMRNNAIIIVVIQAVLNLFVLPLQLMCCYCGRLTSMIEFV